MFKQLMTLDINDKTNLEFFVDDEQMFFWEASMQVRYNKKPESYILLNDIVSEGVITLKNALTRALKCKAQLPDELIEKGVGYWFNIDCTKRSSEALPYNFSDYFLWGTVSDIGNSTYLYNIKDEIVLEISPTYKWHFCEHDNVPGYYPFEEFMKTYKMIDRQVVSKELAEKWLKECCEFIEWDSHILELEKELLKPEVRSSADKIKSLLSTDFFEFGSSGRIYQYDDISAIGDEPGTSYETDGFFAHRLSSDHVLATYRLKKKKPDCSEEYSLRSSLWKRSGGEWKMVFHQGTPVK